MLNQVDVRGQHLVRDGTVLSAQCPQILFIDELGGAILLIRQVSGLLMQRRD
jgi:hypothetical protein